MSLIASTLEVSRGHRTTALLVTKRGSVRQVEVGHANESVSSGFQLQGYLTSRACKGHEHWPNSEIPDAIGTFLNHPSKPRPRRMPGLRISSHYLQLKKIGLHLQVRAQGAGKKGQGKKGGRGFIRRQAQRAVLRGDQIAVPRSERRSPIHFSASERPAGSMPQVRTRPTFSVCTSPLAVPKHLKVLNYCSKSNAERPGQARHRNSVPCLSLSTIARRVGSPRAWNTRSRSGFSSARG